MTITQKRQKIILNKTVKMKLYAQAQGKGDAVLHFTCGVSPDSVLVGHLYKIIDAFNSQRINDDDPKLKLVKVCSKSCSPQIYILISVSST